MNRHVNVIVTLLVCLSSTATLFAEEAGTFQVIGDGIESRELVNRIPRPPGKALFEKKDNATSGLSAEVTLPDLSTHFSDLTALGGYWGICTGDVDGDGLPDFFTSSPTGQNYLYLNEGDFRFTDITEVSNIGRDVLWSSGVSFADINNDGRLDLFVCGFRTPNRLFINQGNSDEGIPQFVEQAEAYGLNQARGSMQMAFADFDNDGDLDGYLATAYVPPPKDVQLQVRYEGNRPVVLDELSEFWELLYLPGDRAKLTHSGQRDHLFRNDGGHFTDITESAEIDGVGSTLGVVWWDYNSDGLADLYVANDFKAPDKLYLNQGDGTFMNVISDSVFHTPWSSMGVDYGDLNNDGRLDLVATDMLGSTHYRRNMMQGGLSESSWFLSFGAPRQYRRNAVYINTGTGRMLETAYLTGMAATDWTWAPRIEDFDNDGRQDVLFTNGMVRDVQNADLTRFADQTFGVATDEWADFWAEESWLNETNLAFRNLGDLNFERVESEWGLDHYGVTYGAATADFDNDGDLDLVMNNANSTTALMENLSHGRNLIRVELRGEVSNHFGVGATIRVIADGLEQVRYLAIAHGWEAGNEMVTHFGLGNADSIDSLTVEWPGGVRQEFHDLPVNQYYRIREPSETLRDSRGRDFETEKEGAFVRSSILDSINIDPPAYDDLIPQPLLPRRLSWQRFCMEWGDIDRDGDADLFLGGGAGKPGRIFVQEGDGNFSGKSMAPFSESINSEDRAARFADIDSDGDLDLVVTNGGIPLQSAANEPGVYLYLNDGKGGFTAAMPESLPRIEGTLSCISAGDFDEDGDLDLFLGGGIVPGRYPMSNRSYLLMNEEGRFKDITPDSLSFVGHVTDAIWADVTGDGRSDLMLTSEWGPVRLFINNGTTLRESSETGIENLSGWWNSIDASDIDGDGDIDFAAGNNGLNTFYKASGDSPARLYYGQFMEGAPPLTLETYFESGREYPVRGLEQIAQSLPLVGQRFSNFHHFSTAEITDIFPVELLEAAQRFEVNTLESGVLINDGSGGFEFKPLPNVVQVAPVNDLLFEDINNDSRIDLVVAQNDFSVTPVVGRFDGGISLTLAGDGTGNFMPEMPSGSGIVVDGEARELSSVDLNNDGKRDLVFGIPGDGFRAFVAR